MPTPNYKIIRQFLFLTPIINLPIIRIAMEGARPMMIAPIVKRTSANNIVGLRPYESLTGPAISDPTAAPS